MECALQKQSDLKPAPFDSSFSRLTHGQKLLLDLIMKHIESNTPITRDDIGEVYGQAMGVKELHDYGRDENGQWGYRRMQIDVRQDKYRKKWRSLQWFKNNIGACILKGKLIVIPAIEL